MLPSDSDYIPAATDPLVLECSVYKKFLSMNTDPYAKHSYEPALIELIEGYALGRYDELSTLGAPPSIGGFDPIAD